MNLKTLMVLQRLYDHEMKMFVLAGMLLFGCVLAAAPTKYETLSPTPLWKYQVYGKVKSVKSCDAAGKSCSVQEFNPYGVPMERLYNRKLVSDDGQKVIFETVRPQNTINAGKRVEIYLEGKISTIENWNPNQALTSRTSFQYDQQGKLITIESYSLYDGEETLEFSEKISYKNSNISQVVRTQDFIVTTLTFNEFGFIEKDTFSMMEHKVSINNTYQYDKHNNWIKQYVDGQLKNVRSIEYYED